MRWEEEQRVPLEEEEEEEVKGASAWVLFSS